MVVCVHFIVHQFDLTFISAQVVCQLCLTPLSPQKMATTLILALFIISSVTKEPFFFITVPLGPPFDNLTNGLVIISRANIEPEESGGSLRLNVPILLI